MAISGNIYQNLQTPDILGGVERGLKMSDMIQERQSARAEQERQSKMNQVLKQGMIVDENGIVQIKPESMAAFAGVAKPQEMMQYSQQMQAQQKAMVDQAQSAVKQGSQILQAVRGKPELWSAARGQLSKIKGLDMSMIPEVYDEKQIDFLSNKAMTAMEQIQNAQKQREFGLKEQELALKRQQLGKEVAKEKAPTAAQSSVAGYAKRLAQAEQALQDVREKGYKREEIGAAIGSFAPNRLRSSEAQMQDQAERNFINAVLRRESGAAIAPSEFESAEIQYFPRSGDTEDVIKQKEANRRQVFESFKAEGGQAFDKIPTIEREQTKDNPAWAK